MPNLLYNSLCCKYSLSVRLLVLLFLISTISSACTPDVVNSDEMAQEYFPDMAAADTTATRRSSPKEQVKVSLLGNPFIANVIQGNSLSTYYERINDDFTVDADPIENRHQPSITDTIYTIRFGNSMIEFYAPSQTGDLLLQIADIQSNSITLRNNLRVGMSQTELLGKLKVQEVQIAQTPNEVIASNLEGAPASLHFYLKNGKVSRILYEGYVD